MWPWSSRKTYRSRNRISWNIPKTTPGAKRSFTMWCCRMPGTSFGPSSIISSISCLSEERLESRITRRFTRNSGASSGPRKSLPMLDPNLRRLYLCRIIVHSLRFRIWLHCCAIIPSSCTHSSCSYGSSSACGTALHSMWSTLSTPRNWARSRYSRSSNSRCSNSNSRRQFRRQRCPLRIVRAIEKMSRQNRKHKRWNN